MCCLGGNVLVHQSSRFIVPGADGKLSMSSGFWLVCLSEKKMHCYKPGKKVISSVGKNSTAER